MHLHFRDEVDSVILNHEKVVRETKVQKVQPSVTKPVSPVTQVRQCRILLVLLLVLFENLSHHYFKSLQTRSHCTQKAGKKIMTDLIIICSHLNSVQHLFSRLYRYLGLPTRISGVKPGYQVITEYCVSSLFICHFGILGKGARDKKEERIVHLDSAVHYRCSGSHHLPHYSEHGTCQQEPHPQD